MMPFDEDMMRQIENDPELKQAFQQQWQFAMTHPEQFQEISMEFNNFNRTMAQTEQVMMSWLQAEAMLKTPKEERPEELDMMFESYMTTTEQNAVNIFEEIIGPGYGKKFDQVINAGANDRLSWMDGMVWESTLEDSELSEEKKELLKTLSKTMHEAFCTDGMPERLLKVLENTPESYIRKIYMNPVRLDRVIDNIEFAIHKLRIYRIKAKYIPIFFTSMALSFKWEYYANSMANKIYIKPDTSEESTERKPKKKQKKDLAKEMLQYNKPHTPGIILGILLDKYLQSCKVLSYDDIWFVAMFIKHLSVSCLISSMNKGFDSELQTEAKNLFQFVNKMLEKYCCIEPVSEDLKKMDVEIPDMPEITVPTKEEWNNMKEEMSKSLDEREKEYSDKMRQISESHSSETTISESIETDTASEEIVLGTNSDDPVLLGDFISH